MPLTLGIRYITGYAIATDPASRERPEWPPHPARVFMAMSAAHFETGEDPEEADALRWLEALLPPLVHAADADERSLVRTFVPVNDAATGAGLLQAAVGLTRNKQPRTFPRVRPHDEYVYLVWPRPSDAEVAQHRPTLESLCRKVTRIGHTSSLVQMWVSADIPGGAERHVWEPQATGQESEMRLRIFRAGTLKYLEQQFGEAKRQEYRQKTERLVALKAQQRTLRGRNGREQKAEIQEQIDALTATLPRQPPPEPLRPHMSLWQCYHRHRRKQDEAIPHSAWDPSFVVRRLVPDDSRHTRLDLAATLQVTAAMHKAVVANAREPVAEFISGHTPDGWPSERPHLAYFPLAFVGREHATGHLLGLGIALPENLDHGQRRVALAAVGQVKVLTMGPLGKWTLVPDELARLNLRPDLWTAGEEGATKWATISPIAFDQHSKLKDRVEQEKELAAMVARGCERIGLPAPRHVVIAPISVHLGVPAAYEFPRLKRKDGSQRRHTHAILIFDKKVRGPISIGAGRYRGYGFCRPVKAKEGLP